MTVKEVDDMKRIMVRYKVKSDRAKENADNIRGVFEELNNSKPEGIRYASFEAEDGVSFVYIVSIETADGNNPLADSPAFKAFQEGIKDRFEELPVAVELTEVGSYQFF